MKIYVTRNNQRYGPYTPEQAHAYIKSGHLHPDDLAWSEGAAIWEPLSRVLQPPEQTASPFSSLESVSNQKSRRLVWAVGAISIVVVLPAILLLVLQNTAKQKGVRSQKSSAVDSTSPQPQQNGIASEEGWQPGNACMFLSHISGLQTRGYKDLFEGEYSCSSGYKNIGGGSLLSNNIAFYANGSANVVNELKLVLNVHQRQDAKDAHRVLASYSEELTMKALSISLPGEVKNTISSGRTGQWSLGGAKAEVKRDDWPTGRGYELHYVLRRPA
ncbi:MAG TPA: DUF4339 domain-containing protein [Pyrinomonadaceae bacterium]